MHPYKNANYESFIEKKVTRKICKIYVQEGCQKEEFEKEVRKLPEGAIFDGIKQEEDDVWFLTFVKEIRE